MPSKIHNIMANKHNKQRFENKIYTLGLTTHYQLQKNFSKIELSLRQGCQLFTIYVFGSFCWLYLIRSSNQTSESAYSKVDFLFQDILFDTLPLLSENGMISPEINKNHDLTNKETINYFDNQKKGASNRNVSIELTPLFSEKLQNYIGKKPFKSQRLLNSTWKNFELLQKKDQPSFAYSYAGQITPTYDFSKSSAVFAEHKKQECADWKNQEEKHFSTVLASAKCIDVQSKTTSSQTTKDLIFFARKPLFIKAKTNFKISAYNASNALCADSAQQAPQSQLNTNIFLKKQILTQKKAYYLSGTSLIMDPEIDFLPHKLEEGFIFSKIKSFVTPPKEEKSVSINFKPHLTLTESILWCKTLIKTKTEVWLSEVFPFEKKEVLYNINHFHPSKLLTKTSLEKARDKSFKITKTWFNSNSFQPKSLQLPLSFTQKKAKEGAVLVTGPLKTLSPSYEKNQHQHKIIQKNKLNTENNKPKQTVTERLLFEKFLLKKKGSWKSKGQFTNIFNQPRLQSGFYFPNAPIVQKNKEKLKGGLGLIINPRLLFLRKSAIFAKHQPHNLFFTKKDFCKENAFLEWLYQSSPKLEYLSYSGANNKVINLQKKAAQFVILDKHTDLKTSHCILDKKPSYHKKGNTFVEKMFSYKRNSFNGLLDAPESFFGASYLKLGERFTIEKLKSKNKISTLYNIHSEDVFTPQKTGVVHSKPYASMGNSLKTVFGKKQFAISQNQNSKKSSKVQNLITNARLVTRWSKEPSAIISLSTSWSDIESKDNNLVFSNKNENKKVFSDTLHETINNANLYDLSSTATNSFGTNAMPNRYKIAKILGFKRISGKANRNITLPFKYYNPGIKRERNIEDTMLILEGYKKSRLFPTIHNNYRGIATRGLPIVIDIDTVSYTDQDVDLQSILGGMRQRTEKQRIAENLSQPGSENLTTSKEKSQEKEEYSINKKKIIGKHIQQNKKRRLSNYYPLCTSLAVCPQEALPEQALGATNLIEYNFINSFTANNSRVQIKELKGSIQTKGFYFEKLLCSGLQKFPFLNFLDKENWLPISPSFLAKILFFACTWYSYKLLATPLSQSTQFLPATFTEAIGLQSFQQKYRIIRGENSKVGFSFKNLAGAEKTLSELRDLIWTFRLVGTGSPNHKYNLFTLFPYIGSRFGQSRRSVFSKSRNRMLLAGPPGTGKTLLVKTLAAEANLPVIVQPVSSLRMISGVENPVSALFHVARQIKPCIIFLDELDTLGNDVNVKANNYTAEQKLGIRLARKYTYSLLLELDGLTSSTRDLLIIGATNRLETLNPALTRAGRFDTILDFNLPSQEVRTALFSFYLGTEQVVQQNKKLSYKSFWLESYLAGKCYGLSHASIGTIINESALESMLMRSIDGEKAKPLHTLETLERAINSVKTLTSRMVTTNTLSLKSNATLDKPSKQDSFLKNGKNKISKLTVELKSKKQGKSNDSIRKTQQILISNYPFEPEFLVNRIYQMVGSLIFHKKSQYKNNRNSFSKKTRKPFYKISWSCSPYYEYDNVKKSNFAQQRIFTKKTYSSINQNVLPINRKDLQNVLLHEYSGVACLSIYTAAKPLTFKILARAGLYQDPSYVAAILFILKVLTLQSSFSMDCFTEERFSGQGLNQKLPKDSFAVPLARPITKESFSKFSGFVSENNLPKVFFLDTPNLNSSFSSKESSKTSYTEQVGSSSSFQTQKSTLFWKNRKNFLNSFSGFAPDNASLTKQSKQIPQTLLMDLKAANGLTTSWFRIYFSRPFFRYDTFHYIENKEYYPKNNYILKQNTLCQRNVSTLFHTTIKSEISNESKSLIFKKPITNKEVTAENIEQKGKLWGKENKQEKDFSSLTSVKQTLLCKPGPALIAAKQLAVTTLEPKLSSETKESLYLAIVASIFHKSIQFFQKNRELTDYCAYTFLRYGVLYEFYLETICEKF